MEVGLKNGEPKCKKFDPLNYGTPRPIDVKRMRQKNFYFAV